MVRSVDTIANTDATGFATAPPEIALLSNGRYSGLDVTRWDGAAPHAGRGGWTWYTGSAGWLYRVGLEAILGIRRQGQSLSIEPCIPDDWPGYEVDYRYGTATYRITVKRRTRSGRRSLSVDGMTMTKELVPLVDDGRDHNIRLVIG